MAGAGECEDYEDTPVSLQETATWSCDNQHGDWGAVEQPGRVLKVSSAHHWGQGQQEGELQVQGDEGGQDEVQGGWGQLSPQHNPGDKGQKAR